MRNLFFSTKNMALKSHLQTLIRNLWGEDNWVFDTELNEKTRLVIFDTETINFKDFEENTSHAPVVLFCYQAMPLLLQYTKKYYISGIISLEMDAKEIQKTLEVVLENDIFFSDKMIAMLFSNTYNEISENVSSLTDREIEILLMMMNDLTNEDIAGEINVSVRTINAHKGNIMRKVKSKTTSGLIATLTNFSAVLKHP